MYSCLKKCILNKWRQSILQKIQLIYEYISEFLMSLKISDERSHSINQDNKMIQMRTFWLKNVIAFDEIIALTF